MLHYLDDWTSPLAELRRILRPGGRVIVSINHPTVRVVTHPDEDCLATRQYREDSEFDGKPAVLTLWHRPLHAITDAFTAAGFRVAVLAEPKPSPQTPPELLTTRIRTGETTAFVAFIFFVLEAP